MISAPGLRYFLLISATLLIQFMLVGAVFPWTELWSENPIFHNDGAYHWYQIKLAVNFATTNNIVGYDPFFAAGYVGGIPLNASAKLPAILSLMFAPWFSEIIVYKLYVFVSAILCVICAPAASRLLGLSPGTGVIASIFGVFMWWATVFHWYFTAGMTSFVLAAYLTLPYLAIVYQYLRRGGWSLLCILGLLGAFGLILHPLFPIPIVAGTLSYLLTRNRNLAWKRVFILGTILPILCVLPNFFWLIEMLGNQRVAGPYQQIIDIKVIYQEMLGQWKGNAQGSKIYAILFFSSLWACLKAEKSHRDFSRALTVSWILLILLAAVGAAIPGLGEIQPNRFAPVGYLMLVIPAAIGVRTMFATALTQARYPSRFAAASLVVVFIVSGYYFNEVRREVSYDDIGHYGTRPPLVSPVGDYSRWVVDWLDRETSNAGRVLFETSKGRIYDGARMAGYYAYTSDRELIGGPYPFMFFAGFWDGWAFGKAITEIAPEEFLKYMDLYNIGWVVAHSDISKNYLEKLPEATLTSNYKQISTYKIKRELSYFLKGTGRIEKRGHNQLTVSDLSGDPVILKYHFFNGMKSEPDATLVPVKIMDDPVPFIKIINPSKNIQLYLP
jgi:hypothetical protein